MPSNDTPRDVTVEEAERLAAALDAAGYNEGDTLIFIGAMKIGDTIYAAKDATAIIVRNLAAQVERLTAERDEFKGLFVEAAEARDKAGCLGSVPDCIALLNESAIEADIRVTALAAEREAIDASLERDATQEPPR